MLVFSSFISQLFCFPEMDTPISVEVDGEMSYETTLREQFSKGLRALADKILADPAKSVLLAKQLGIAHKVYKQKQMELAEQKLGKRQAEDDDLNFVSRKKRRVSGDLGR